MGSARADVPSIDALMWALDSSRTSVHLDEQSGCLLLLLSVSSLPSVHSSLAHQH